jgi:hypothetical protein
MSSKVAKASTVLVSVAYSEKIVGAIVANFQVIKCFFFAKVV